MLSEQSFQITVKSKRLISTNNVGRTSKGMRSYVTDDYMFRIQKHTKIILTNKKQNKKVTEHCDTQSRSQDRQ